MDIAIIGGGAAGLATAVFAARIMPEQKILVLNSGSKPGLKILISGGTRCNVTNRTVSVADYAGGSSNFIRLVLAGFPATQTVDFFNELGVDLYEEEDNGKLFPKTDRAATVLDALLSETDRLGINIQCSRKVTDIKPSQDGFAISIASETLIARKIVLATGGRSFPKTGSDGSGYELAERLGHTIIPTTPALVPLILDGDFHVPLSGITQDVELSVRTTGKKKPATTRGALLWTHFGISGPVAMDISRHWHRAILDGQDVHLLVNFVPDVDTENVEQQLLEMVATQPKLQLHNAVSRFMPSRVANALLTTANISPKVPLAHLGKETRRQVVQLLTSWPLPVRESQGYSHAEATAGGIALNEVNPRTLASRKCPGLFFAGEILDVDGRIGGFNFQWAWSSAHMAASGLKKEPSDTE